MVSAINVPVDDDVKEEATEIKEELGLTWEGYIEAANECLREHRT